MNTMEANMKIFRVKRGLPVPPRRERNRYPLRDLAVGDGFSVPPNRVPRGTMQGLGRRLGIKLSVMKQKDGSVFVQRVK